MLKKSDLVERIANEKGLTKKDVQTVIDALTQMTIEAVANGESVQIAGFGTFERRERGERTCRNLHTGEEMISPATNYPAFKALTAFKNAVKGA